MKKLFLLTFVVMLLCSWAMADNNSTNPTISSNVRTNTSDKAAAVKQIVETEKVMVKKEVIQSSDKPATSVIESQIEISKAPYSGPKNVPDQNLILQGGDDCATATAIGALPYSNAGTTIGYTDDYDEACPYTGSTSPDVVYSYSPAADVIATISLCAGSDYDTKLYVYENECQVPGDGFDPYACNDDECPGFVSEIACLPMAAGNTYYIVVDGYGGDFGNYTIDITECVLPTGACCVDDICVATNTQAECTAMSGIWHEGEDCANFQCPVLTVTCTDASIYDNGTHDLVNGTRPTANWDPQGMIDDFSLAAPADISCFRVEFIDISTPPGTPSGIQSARVRIYDIPNGIYALDWAVDGDFPVFDYTYTDVTFNEIDSGYDNFGGDVIYFDLCTEASVTLPAGNYGMFLTFPGVGPIGLYWASAAANGTEFCAVWGSTLPIPSMGSFENVAFHVGVGDCVGAEVFGACCDDDTGVCNDNVNIIDCPSGYRFAANTPCSQLNPLCGEVAPCADFTVNAPDSWSGNTCGAGNDCALGANSEEHIYEVVIPNAGLWAIDLCNSAYDTYLYVGTSCCSSDLAAVDDFCGLQSYVELNLSAGTIYVDVEGFSSGCGAYELAIYEVAAPTGACCVDGDCVGTMEQADCANLGGLWYAGQDCATFQCPVLGCIVQLPNAVNGLFADYDFPQWVADNFNIGSATDVYGFEFWGGYFSTDNPMAVDDFTIYIRADAGGVPGAALYTFPNVSATFREQTGVVLFGVHEWRYEVSLGTINLPAGTYWVEINNATFGNVDVWFWETGDLDPVNGIIGSAWGTTSDAGPWNSDGATDLSFRLACEPFGESFGACCDMTTGDCTDNVSSLDCPSGFRFVSNTLCADLVPACGPPTGACCVDLDCVGTLEEADCLALGGVWYVNENCGNFTCPVPAENCDNAIYSNGVPPSYGAVASQCDPVYPFQFAAADDFVLPGSGPVDVGNVVMWFGHWNASPLATPADWEGATVTIYYDAGGIPSGNPIDGDPNCAVEGTFAYNAGYIPGDYVYEEDAPDVWRVSFPTAGLSLDAGTTYWLSIEIIMQFGVAGQGGAAPTDHFTGSVPLIYGPLLGYTEWTDPLWPGDLSFCINPAGGGGEYPCGHYVVGDFNGSDVFNLADVISAFSKLQTGSPDAANLCECPPGGGNTWAIAMDVNGNCAFNLADVISAFSKLQTGSPNLVGCPTCPPDPNPAPRGGNNPLVVPNLESKAKISNQSGME